MTSTPSPHIVAVLALESVVAFDMGIACDVFGFAPGSPAPYDVRVCGETRRIRSRYMDLHAPYGLEALETADTIIVPGIRRGARPGSPRTLAALRRAAERGARLASICSGAFVLAAAGLLDGKRAATHWLAAEELARLHPKVTVDPAVLYVDEGQILTSAGVAAGADLCLHMIRRDHGAAMAAACARMAVVPLERHGGQAQFIVHAPPASPTSLAPLLEWMAVHLTDDQSLEALAERAGMSVRTFLRRFREQTGETPLRWTTLARVRRAQLLLETTALSVEQVAYQVGFGSPSHLRLKFAEIVGVSPATHRGQFSGRPAAIAA